MADAILLLAIPGFLVLMVLEVLVLRRGEAAERGGYERRDSRTSIGMGAGSMVVNGVWRYVELLLLGAVASVTPLHLGDGWLAWTVAMVGVDLAYYVDHRASHEIRLLWASHVVHHSSHRYNLSTALRQTWTGMSTVLFFVPVAAVGVPPIVVFAAWSINLVYQYWIHTEMIDKLPAPIEYVFNTPSHHRVHHGSQSQYLDRNYGGVLIIWDRLFGSFAPEREPVRYGLTKNIATHNLLRVATHEYVAIWRDVRAAASWRDRAGFLLRGPGWAPSAAGLIEAPRAGKPCVYASHYVSQHQTLA